MPGSGFGPASAQGMLFNQLQQMQDQISRQQGVIEELQNQVSRMKQELERYRDLDRRIGSGVAPAATPENSSAGGDASAAAGAAAGAGAAAAARAPAAGSEPADPAKEKLYYDAAFDLIKAKDFDKASRAFAAFLRKYPNSQYAGNAQYWLGEVNPPRVICKVQVRPLPRFRSCIPSTTKCRIRCTSWLT